MNEPHAIDPDYVSFEGITPGYGDAIIHRGLPEADNT